MNGLRLKKLRQEKKLKQSELAKILNISPSAIGMYETNKREPDDALKIRIANFFNVSVAYLVGETNDRKDNKKDIDNDFHALYEDYKEFDEEDKNLLKTMFEAIKKKRKK